MSAARHGTGGAVDAAAVHADAARIVAARPTAVNLSWGVRRALSRLRGGPQAVLLEARAMLHEDEETNRAAARRAAELVKNLCGRRPLRVLTHCNTGRLATTALYDVRAATGAAHEAGARAAGPVPRGRRPAPRRRRDRRGPGRRLRYVSRLPSAYSALGWRPVIESVCAYRRTGARACRRPRTGAPLWRSQSVRHPPGASSCAR
ncbi:hypothetical protein [Streptomyces sp. DH12]|uniref:hypothetical protein n=1 Tax=Streptomyces sp. DH12 TaxID=2857010 RepID=UPI001E2E38FF